MYKRQAVSDVVTSIIDVGAASTGSHVSIYCVTTATCKVVAHDIDAGTLVFVNCADGTSSGNDIGCIGITPDILDDSVSTTAGAVPVAVNLSLIHI